MARALSAEESQRVRSSLERRLGEPDFAENAFKEPSPALRSDFGAYPVGFPEHLIVSQDFGDKQLIEAIKMAVSQLGETALYYVAKEYVEGQELDGLEWEIPISELTASTFAALNQAGECYLYSVHDQWAIYFHHEGFAVAGGEEAFINALKKNCQELGVEIVPSLAEWG